MSRKPRVINIVPAGAEDYTNDDGSSDLQPRSLFVTPRSLSGEATYPRDAASAQAILAPSYRRGAPLAVGDVGRSMTDRPAVSKRGGRDAGISDEAATAAIAEVFGTEPSLSKPKARRREPAASQWVRARRSSSEDRRDAEEDGGGRGSAGSAVLAVDDVAHGAGIWEPDYAAREREGSLRRALQDANRRILELQVRACGAAAQWLAKAGG
jgi:hypothetical protein